MLRKAVAGIKKKSTIWIAGGLCAALFAGILFYDGLFARAQVTETAFAMGSVVYVTASGKKEQVQDIAATAVQAVQQLENQISNKKENSEISQINAGTGSVEAKNTVGYTEQCVALSRWTKGAFDITVGALSRLWDFDNEQNIVPSQVDIASGLATVGYDKIQINGETVRVPPGTVLDLGAAGKGLACSYVIDVLKSLGASDGIVTVGGSVGVYGRPAKVGIRDPFSSTNQSFAVLRYTGAVASTSGVYEKHFEQEGVHYHHILDPFTGYPVQNDLVSVTVICPDGLASDALATACFKLGYEESMEALDAYEAMAVFVYRDKTVKTYNERYSFKISDGSYEKQTV